MKAKGAFVGNTNFQTGSNQIKSEQDLILEKLLQAPLSEGGFEQILSLIYERQRADSAEESVPGSPRNPDPQPGDAAQAEPLVR